ncbi:MAG TPA: hypothetical protein PLF96_08520 [Thermotogota bacterium]|nr:hypothetical protein [Thermotogota bacterium]
MFEYKCLVCNFGTKSAAPNDGQVCPQCGDILYRVRPSMRIGEILVLFGWAREADVNKALQIQKDLAKDARLGEVLVSRGFSDDESIQAALFLQLEEAKGNSEINLFP